MNLNKMDKINENNSRKCPKKSKSSRSLLFPLIGIAVIVILGMLALVPMVFEGAEKNATIRIPANANAEMVEDSIAKYLGEGFASKVMRYAKIRNIDFASRHGAYFVPEGASPLLAMKIIFRRAQTPVRVTFNNVRNLDRLADKASAKMEFNAEEFAKAVTDSAMLASYGLKPDQFLALFIDDTFEFYWADSPETVIKKIGNNYKSYWSPARVKKAKELGLEPIDVMILASIVDEETNKKREKGKIARLYINRLEKGMRLQSDPTVRFALGDYTIKRIRKGHLDFESPYNTYKYPGLPPAPIRTTSRQTLDKILTSTPNDYLYMCAKEDFSGFHNFAATYDEHMKNALRYQHALDARGIK